MNFEPQRVDPESWKAWFREALALTGRRPIAFVALTLGLAALGVIPALGDLLRWVLLPLFLGLGCRLAAEADAGGPSRRAIAGLSVRALVHLMVLGLIPLAAMAVLAALLNVLLPESEPLFPNGPPAIPWVPFEEGIGVIISLSMWLFLSAGLIWTLPALVALADLPLRPAVGQATEALERNSVLLRLALGGAGGLFFGVLPLGLLIGGVTAVVVFPLLCSMMYVSYRHIWWDRPRNQPDRQTVSGKMPSRAAI